jgi:thiol-disulfide isomerase/thioredoxin
MNFQGKLHWLRRSLSVCVVALLLVQTSLGFGADRPPAMKQYQPVPDEFLSLSNSVFALLRNGNAVQFAQELTSSEEDWKSVMATNLPKGDSDPLQSRLNASKHERQKLEASAKAFVDRAASLHLDFSKGDLRLRVIAPEHFGNIGMPDILGDGGSLPWTEKVEFVLFTDAVTNGAVDRDFKFSIHGMMRFPAGWRSYDGIRWDSFPAGVADEKTQREMSILAKVTGRKPLTGSDDPALLKLAETLVRFIRERDLKLYEREALINGDIVWNTYKKSGRPGPSREELEKHLGTMLQDQLLVASNVLQQMESAGIDLKKADISIKDISIRQLNKSGAEDSLDGLMGSGLQLQLTVKSDAKAKNGAPISGDYVLGVKQLGRFNDEWRVAGDIHWQELPSGVIDEKTAAAMKFENYVAEHRTLPPASAAPEIEFVTLQGGKKMKLSDLRGKIVVLDFWATWCGPCQQPMADLQKVQGEHPDWKDKVAIVSLSIDDEIVTVRKHVEKRGWTNTFNVWAGEGGWQSVPAKTFRVTGVPTTYILDREGKIVVAGHPASMRIEERVAELLK